MEFFMHGWFNVTASSAAAERYTIPQIGNDTLQNEYFRITFDFYLLLYLKHDKR